MKTPVLHIIDSLDLGGAQTALLNMLRYTNRERFTPIVASMHGRGVFWKAFADLNILVLSLSPSKWFPFYVLHIAWLILRHRPLIVHCHLFGSNWIGKPVANFLGVPVRINHDQCNDALRVRSKWAFLLDKFTNRLSSHICAVSESTRKFLVESEHIPESRVSVVYNGVDVSRFPAVQRKTRTPFIVLGVGRLHPQKNFILFLDVAAALLKEGLPIRFRLAGTGPEGDALRRHAAALDITDHVEFLGHVSDTVTLYENADALLMTSQFEGTPLTALEAMASQLPIVVPRLDGLAEILTDEKDALLVSPPGDRDGYVRQIKRLFNSEPLRNELGVSARKTVTERYSAAAMAAQVEAIYERCLHEVHT